MRLQELRKKQAENFAVQSQKHRKRQSDLLKNLNEKLKLAAANATAKMKKQIENIAERNKQQAQKQANGLFKKYRTLYITNRAKNKTTEDLLRTYLTELEERYVTKQVKESVEKSNEAR